MPIYRDRTRDKWQVRIWKDNQVQTWRVDGSKADAEAFEARKRIDLESAPALRSAAPTFLHFLLHEYRPHAELRLKKSWLRNQSYTLATLGVELGEIELTDITTHVIESFARRRLAGGLKEVSVNNEVRILRRVLSYAEERGCLDRVPKFAALPERGETRGKAWSHDDVARLMEACGKLSPTILPMVVFLANTGCRRGEALALTWDNVDLDRGLVKVWPSPEWQPKNGKPREVPIADALVPWLKLPRTSRYVFPTRTGKGYTTWPARMFDRARTAAELQGGAHCLRHTFASHFLATTPDLSLLADILGHSDTAVTRLYKHLLPDHLARARNAVQMGATPAAAEMLALARWRLSQKPYPEPYPGDEEAGVTMGQLPSERATGVEPATSSLGSTRPRRKILELLTRKR